MPQIQAPPTSAKMHDGAVCPVSSGCIHTNLGSSSLHPGIYCIHKMWTLSSSTHSDITQRAETPWRRTWAPVDSQSEDTFLLAHMNIFCSKHKGSPHEGPVCMTTNVAQIYCRGKYWFNVTIRCVRESGWWGRRGCHGFQWWPHGFILTSMSVLNIISIIFLFLSLLLSY